MANKILTKSIARKMECRVVIGTLPIFPLRATPRNPGIAGSLRVLAQSSQASEQGQIIRVNRHTEMELVVSAGRKIL